MKTVIVNPPIVSDTYVFIAIINELGGTAKIYNKRLFIDASTICNANIPFFLGKCIHGEYYGAAEPPVRCGESHLSGLTEPPHFVY